MPAVTLVIRWSFGMNYARTLNMEAVKAPEMSEHLCQRIQSLIQEQRNPLRKNGNTFEIAICN